MFELKTTKNESTFKILCIFFVFDNNPVFRATVGGSIGT